MMQLKLVSVLLHCNLHITQVPDSKKINAKYFELNVTLYFSLHGNLS